MRTNRMRARMLCAEQALKYLVEHYQKTGTGGLSDHILDWIVKYNSIPEDIEEDVSNAYKALSDAADEVSEYSDELEEQMETVRDQIEKAIEMVRKDTEMICGNEEEIAAGFIDLLASNGILPNAELEDIVQDDADGILPFSNLDLIRHEIAILKDLNADWSERLPVAFLGPFQKSLNKLREATEVFLYK